MKRLLAVLLALILMVAFGCSASKQAPVPTPTATPTATPVPTPTPEPTPSPTPAPPEGLSSQPFDFVENTYAIWRVVRHAPVDGMVQYEVQLLAMDKTIYCHVSIENDQITGVSPSYTLELIQATGDSIASLGAAIFNTYDLADFATSFGAESPFALAQYVLSYTFTLPETDALPTVAELSYSSENALATIEFSNPILIDAES